MQVWANLLVLGWYVAVFVILVATVPGVVAVVQKICMIGPVPVWIWELQVDVAAVLIVVIAICVVMPL